VIPPDIHQWFLALNDLWRVEQVKTNVVLRASLEIVQWD